MLSGGHVDTFSVWRGTKFGLVVRAICVPVRVETVDKNGSDDEGSSQDEEH